MRNSFPGGQTMAEYILVIALIAIALLTLFARFRKPAGSPAKQPAAAESAR